MPHALPHGAIRRPAARPAASAPCRERIEAIFQRFHRHEHVARDPLTCVYRYAHPADREVVGLISALLAYGNVTAILRALDAVFQRMHPQPAAYLLNRSPRTIRRHFAGFRYRVTGEADFVGLLLGVRTILGESGTLAPPTPPAAPAADESPAALPAMAAMVDRLVAAARRPLPHLLSHPARGSACKRLNLYFRWMVRQDAIDPGGWTTLKPADLIVPLDTHLHRVATALGLTRRKQANLATAIEITAGLRQIDPTDPLRFDFALTRPGILRVAEGV